MFETDNTLSVTTLAAALSGYGIDFMKGSFYQKVDARGLSQRSQTSTLKVSFIKPVFDKDTK